MTERLRSWLLRFLRVPAQPSPPPGDPRLIRTFRAAPNYFRYKIIVWALTQVSAAAGLVLSYFFFRNFIVRFPFAYFGIIEQLAIAGFIAQLPFSFALLRLDFEMRWYILSDRSLRIRAGILSVREQTMTFANVQNISIRQNPLQRLFGISTIAVRAAGGGGGSSTQHGSRGGRSASHEATFAGVADADRIRAAIRERVRLHRDAGLGDPDEDAPAVAPGYVAAATAPDEASGDPHHASPASDDAAASPLRPAVEAAHRVLAEAGGLRAALARLTCAADPPRRRPVP